MMWKVTFLTIAALLCIEKLSAEMQPGGARVLTEKEIQSESALQDMDSILMESADIYNKRSNSLYAYRITGTVQIAKRVVAGIEYDIKVNLKATACNKNTDKIFKKDLQNCQLKAENGSPKTCTFTAWFRPWLVLGAPAPVQIDFKGCQ